MEVKNENGIPEAIYDKKTEPEVNYENLGLRHVKVENASLPKIEIFCGGVRSEGLAKAVGYGIEEEGLPYRITFGECTRMDAYEVSHRAGLGVSILVQEGNVSVFARQLQEKRPLFDYPVR
ncbi:MAG TPA: glycerol dehydratase reactivase beta/small subunit family protein, partial [Anaerovoracaceae bacterium]|nr:glycerol dehydratase reactivase beta/small subunit family protein [Anaerovoracaceae bacterium]